MGVRRGHADSLGSGTHAAARNFGDGDLDIHNSLLGVVLKHKNRPRSSFFEWSGVKENLLSEFC